MKSLSLSGEFLPKVPFLSVSHTHTCRDLLWGPLPTCTHTPQATRGISHGQGGDPESSLSLREKWQQVLQGWAARSQGSGGKARLICTDPFWSVVPWFPHLSKVTCGFYPLLLPLGVVQRPMTEQAGHATGFPFNAHGTVIAILWMRN